MSNENKVSQLVTVITPTYNSENYIAETIESVLNQTYKHFEMIIVDDGSKDKTVKIIEQYLKKDDRLKMIRLKQNQGAAVARNTAINNANGRYLAFLDSDDLWLPEKLEKQLKFMQEKDVAFSFTKYVRMKENGELTKNISKAPETITYNDLLKHCVIGCLTVILDKEKIDTIQMENIRRRQDYALWLSITKKGIKAY